MAILIKNDEAEGAAALAGLFRAPTIILSSAGAEFDENDETWTSELHNESAGKKQRVFIVKGFKASNLATGLILQLYMNKIGITNHKYCIEFDWHPQNSCFHNTFMDNLWSQSWEFNETRKKKINFREHQRETNLQILKIQPQTVGGLAGSVCASNKEPHNQISKNPQPETFQEAQFRHKTHRGLKLKKVYKGRRRQSKEEM